jgi:DNA-binding NarL/FixJ family response regulator
VSAPVTDAVDAERAWLDGDALAAIAAADQVLEAGTDVDGRAAGVAAAAAAADGALRDAAARWRAVAAALEGSGAAWAAARAALAAALAGDVPAAEADLDLARDRMPDPAPRGLTLLVDGTAATLDALHGAVEPAARRLAGLAAATVPPDPLAPEQWGELAATVAAAGGHDRAARAMLTPLPGQPVTPRRHLLLAWLDLRTGNLSAAREALAAPAGTVLRRTAVLAAAVSVGLARRTGDEQALAATWMRVSPVVAGADVEPLLLDAWGELASAAALAAPEEGAALTAALSAAVVAAGSPWWAVAVEQWWRLDRAVARDDADVVADAAQRLAALAERHPGLRVRAGAAGAFATVLGSGPGTGAGPADPDAVAAEVARLAAAGHRWEAAQLCRAATARTADPAAARTLLEAGRRLRGTRASRPGERPDALSDREREVGALVVDGLTHKEIGARLYLSPKTVEQHVAHLRRKLRASSRATLVAALRAQLGS